MTKLCICQLCTCGRHKCPHRPWGITGKGDQPCAMTEYRNEFRGHEIDRRTPFKPGNEYKTDVGPMQSETTNKHDFIKHPIDRIRLHSPEHYKKPDGEMDTTTSYNREYVAKKADRAAPIKHEAMKRDGGRFEGKPTYSEDYRQWQIQKVDPIIHGPAYTPSQEVFGGDSTYDRDFIRHAQATRSLLRPDHAAVASGQPFDDRTGYRQDFVKHEIPQRYFKPKDEYQQTKHPLDSMTTNRRDFTPKEGDRMRSFKPEGNGYRSEAPFDANTTNKNDYKKWITPPYVPHKHDVYEAPPGDMDLTTNYSKEFMPKPVQRVAQIKPAQRPITDAKFLADTTYGQDFRKWPGNRTEPARSQSVYAAPTATFDGTSTYKTQFVPHKGGPSNSCKPDGAAYNSGAPFDGSTLYRLEYTPKEAEPCPAGLLEKPTSDFRFANEDTRGHKYYTPSPRIGYPNSNKPLIA